MVGFCLTASDRPKVSCFGAAVPDAVAGGPRRPYIFGVCRIGRFG